MPGSISRPLEAGFCARIPHGSIEQGLQELGYVEGRYAHKVTRTLPIIFVGVIDPEERGIVSLWNPANPTNQTQLTNTEAAARMLGVQVQPLPINSPDDFEPAFKAARGGR